MSPRARKLGLTPELVAALQLRALRHDRRPFEEGLAILTHALMSELAYLAEARPPEGLDALQALSDAATPGRWFVDDGEEVSSEHSEPLRQNPWPVVADREGLLPAVELADAAFIVAAVNYVRARLSAGGAE